MYRRFILKLLAFVRKTIQIIIFVLKEENQQKSLRNAYHENVYKCRTWNIKANVCVSAGYAFFWACDKISILLIISSDAMIGVTFLNHVLFWAFSFFGDAT